MLALSLILALSAGQMVGPSINLGGGSPSAVVGAGEQSGHLPDVLNQLANDLEDQQLLRSKLLSASLYPAIVSLIA